MSAVTGTAARARLPRSHWPLAAGVLAAALAALLAGLATGAADVPALRAVAVLFSPADDVASHVVWGLRLPRLAAAFACGGLLALAGALLQALLRNPLADPYVLGASGAAAVGALGAMLAGLGAFAVHGAAAAGALGNLGLLFALAWRRSDAGMLRVLLTGVVLSAGWGALVALMLALAPHAAVKGMLFWLMGDLSQAPAAGGALATLAAGVVLAWTAAPALDVLALGGIKARSLGVAAGAVRLAACLLAGTATAAALAVGGAIGFVGLLAPHALRLAGVAGHRWLLPLSALAGGALLVIADTLARTAWAPAELPVGVITALLGVPLLLLLLGGRHA